MKTLLSLSIICLLLAGASRSSAQDAPAAAPQGGGGMQGMLSSLTPDEKAKYEAAHDKALADNPELKAEQDSLMQQGQTLRSGNATPDEKQAFRQKMKDHMDKMKTALLKEDSTLQPVLDKLEKARAEMRAKRAQQGAGAAGAQ